MKTLSVYLCGAIRDGEMESAEDAQWRLQVKERLEAAGLIVLNPMDGQKYHQDRKKWTHYGFPSSSESLVDQDCMLIANSDILIADFFAFETGYPCIGSFMEIVLGRTDVARPKVIYVISENPKILNHPFIKRFATRLFDDRDDCLEYVEAFAATALGK